MTIIRRTEELIRLFDTYFKNLQAILSFLETNGKNIILKSNSDHIVTNFTQTINSILPFKNRIEPYVEKLRNCIKNLNANKNLDVKSAYNTLGGLISNLLVSPELLELLPYLGWLSQKNLAFPMLEAKLNQSEQQNASLNTFQTQIASQMQTLTRLPLLVNEIKNDYKKEKLSAAEDLLYHCHNLIKGTVSYINTRDKRIDKFIFSHLLIDYNTTLEHYCEKVILHSTRIYNHNYYHKVRTSIYNNWLQKSNTSISKCSFLNSPKRSHTRKIEKLIKDYNGFYEVDKPETKLEHSEILLKEVANWLTQQDNALFPCYSNRYFAMKDLQFDLEMEVLKIKDNYTFDKQLNDYLQNCYDQVKNLVENNNTNSTGIWQMHKVFCHVLKNQLAENTHENFISELSLENKITAFKAIKSIAYNRLYNDLPQFYYRSALFGKGRSKEVDNLYCQINNYNLYESVIQDNRSIEEKRQHSRNPSSNTAAERLAGVIKISDKKP